MDTDVNHHNPPTDFGDEIKSTVDHVKVRAKQNYEACEQRVRQSPKKAVLIALGAGYCLNTLPVGTLIALPIRLTAILAKPTLLALGALKLYELVGDKARK